METCCVSTASIEEVILMICCSNKDELTEDVLKNSSIIILPGCRNPFNENELTALKKYLESGGKILALLHETSANDTSNVNILLEQYGITPNMGIKYCVYIF